MHRSFGHSAIMRLFPPPKYLRLPAAGVDISDSSVKLVVLEDTMRGRELDRYEEVMLKDGVIADGEIKDLGELSRSLRDLLRKHGVTFVRASLPEEKTFLFQTTLQKDVEPDQIRNLLEFKLEENVPVNPAEAMFDYELVEPVPGRPVEVSVAVFPRMTVESYTEAFRAAGVLPLSFEVEAQAIARSVIPHGDQGTYLIVDFGRTRTGLGIVSKGVLMSTSTLEIGGNDLTRAIVKQFSVPGPEAEKIKDERGFTRNREGAAAFESLMSTLSALGDELKRHYNYWHSRTKESGVALPRIEKLILCGGNSNLKGLPEYLGSQLNIPIERANVWANAFSLDEVIPPLTRELSYAYATAVGLALRDDT